ncbi:ADP-ribosylation factor-binding protein GGA1-like [Corticium candelabrum]|uniref:ADP-ribosylation factor-binding protein GGA1-like n=1 Tax=Corticium candelabrum TaxID=121492 RepID=UPI002E311FE1|nr:ADP-ribosylation factor-binding protein GGA1-like [Corticium candelabrum]
MVDRRLSTFLDKATSLSLKTGPEWSSVNEFCREVSSSQDGPLIALRLLLVKIQSTNETVALMSLSVLESAMRNCGKTFHQEVGRFKFLNELIKLVSPKYDGAKTPSVVKQEIKQLLNKWSINIPREPKIAQAVQMLRDQGLFTDADVAPVESPREREQRAIPFEDKNKSELLARLLKSKHPEDLKAANRLIKEMVKQDDYKLQKLTRRMEVLETAKNNMKLLHDMLVNYESGQGHDIVRELHRTCEEMRPKLFQLAQEMDEGDEGIGDVLVASDDLNRVMNEYELVVVKGERLPRGPLVFTHKPDPPTPDPVSLPPSEPSGQGDLDLLLDLGFGTPQPEAVASSTSQAPTLNDKPGVSLLENELLALGLAETSGAGVRSVQPGGINALFQAQQSMPLQQTLPQQQVGVVQPAVGLTGGMPQLGGGLQLGGVNVNGPMVQPLAYPAAPSHVSDLQATASLTTNTMLPLLSQQAVVPAAPPSNVSQSGDALTLAALDTLVVPLETIQPGPHQPTLAYDKNGVRILIYTAKDTPLPNVLVFVVSISSSLPHPVTSVVFQAAVPKTMRVKLQLPSGSELPAFNPIQPTQSITQIMLLANPNREKIRLRYKVMYNIGQQQVTDMGEASNFPVQ